VSVLTTPAAVSYLCARLPQDGTRRPIGPDTLTRWAAEGAIPAVRVGRGWLFATEALDAWLPTFGAKS